MERPAITRSDMEKMMSKRMFVPNRKLWMEDLVGEVQGALEGLIYRCGRAETAETLKSAFCFADLTATRM